MHHTYMRLPVVRFLFRDAKVIPIAPARENEETMHAAFDKIADELAAGEIVCIFPEGRLTRDGRMDSFRCGIEKIIDRTPVPVIPMAIDGMWGSLFSRFGSGLLRQPLRRLRSKVRLTIGDAVAPEKVTADGLAIKVSTLGGWPPPDRLSSAELAVQVRASLP
jgi:1-acyl-sn-glycerol-3-phosphate acyltransferase